MTSNSAVLPRSRALFVLLSVLLAACNGTSPAAEDDDPSPSAAPTSTATPTAGPLGRYGKIACALPQEQIQRIYDGYHTVRSGDIQFLPHEPNFVGNFSSHSGPWDYLQRVPLFLYGPGHVPAVGEVDGPATVADLAPTYAEYLDFDFEAASGEVLDEAVGNSERPPKLILTVVWDGGGRNVLEQYPDAWPQVRGLIDKGVWYEDAIVGSSPSVTPAIHSTMGTGAFPRTHGIVDLRFRVEGAVDPSAFERSTLMEGPSLADLYDVANENRPVIGMVGAEGTLGMIGHGSAWEGGDKDIAAGSRAGEWGLAGNNTNYYEFPAYVPSLPGYDEIPSSADRDDGTVDGTWQGLELTTADSYTLTPAYATYQNGVIEEIMRREGFGQDEQTDLLFVNYKQIDKVGHKFSFPSPQMERVVTSSDEAFASLIEMLDREVGEGEWVISLTADHGSTPKPETTGATIIDNFEVNDDLLETFDTDGDDVPAIQSLRVTQAWVDIAELEEQGHTLEDISRYLMEYTATDNADPGEVVPPEIADEPLFAAAFPGRILPTLPCVNHDG